MSHERLSRFASKEAVADLLAKIGSDIKFEKRHSDLLSQYRNIGYGEEAALDRVAAIEAHREIEKSYADATLNEQGIQLPLQDGRVYEPGYGNSVTREEKQYMENTVQANIQFLELWDQLRGAKRRSWAETNQSAEYYQSQVTDVIRDNPQFLTMPGIVIGVINELGFNMPAGFNIDPVAFVERGIEFQATNPEGDRIDIKMTSSGVYHHLHDEASGNRNCKERSDDLSKRIQKALGKHLDAMGGFGSISEGSGYGFGSLDLGKANVAESEEAQATHLPTETPNLTL